MSLYSSDTSSADSRKPVVAAYLEIMRLLDDRVAPLLGKVTTRVLVQGAARRVAEKYPFLHFLERIPYTEVTPAIAQEQLGGQSPQELTAALNALLEECFAGLKELTGDLIVTPLHDEVTRQLQHMSIIQ
ncbi:MAG: hypothetical protein IRZ31_10260 [Thermogemmatispora sp.]|uniref:hypothetical protein n=1 Tax=Thermogemmatispora sp. TaxID=1968838 RepID=UPI0026209B88|nr:hypothetical protein [Thermogemmatispora sp.]MBX5457274.1 hypothetical protein [Thermogemmatispora sp.]